MKLTKNIKIKLFVLVAFLVLMFVQVGPYLLYADENELTFSYKRINLVATNEYYNSNNLFFSEAYVGQNLAYCLDYGIPLPVSSGGTVKYTRTLSGVATAALVYGYPNVSASSLGVNSNEEAMLATQLAVWRIAKASGDSQKTNYILDMKNLKPTAGYEEYMDRVKTAAQLIIDRAKAAPYYANPKLDLIDNAKLVIKDDKILVGPYKIKGEGFNITSVEVGFRKTPMSAVICDASGKAKNNFKNGDDVYVKLDKSDAGKEFELKVTEKGNHNVGKVYGTGNSTDGLQDYCFLATYPDELTVIQPVQLPLLRGTFKIVKVDQYNNPLQGVVFELKDSTGKVINKATTNAKGIIEFKDLEIGKYVVQEITALDGYVMMDVPVQMEVKYNDVTTLTVENKKIEGGLKIIKYGEDKKTPIAGVTFQVLDSNKKVVDTIVTNSKGEALSNKLAAGKYYFKEVSAVPEAHVVIDSTEHEFTIEDANVTKTYPVWNYYTRGILTITKVTEDNKPIEGVEFEILNSNKEVIDTIVTDAKGVTKTQKLKYGTYYYREKSVPEEAKVVLNTNLVKFVMEYEDKAVTVKNNYKKAQIRVIKTGDDGSKIPDVTFNILDENGAIVDTVVTDENGMVTSKKLLVGKYFCQEVNCPDPRVIVDTETKHEVNLTKNNTVVDLKVVNKTKKSAQIKIIKTGDDGSKIPNVTFDIFDENRTKVTTVITDKDGIAISKKLVLGKYFCKEVHCPDTKVIVDKVTEHEVNLTKNNSTVELRVVNKIRKLAQIKIIKTADDGSKLEGVKFQILDSNKKVVGEVITDKDGIAISEELELGKYFCKEVYCPDEKVIADTKTEHEVNLTKNNAVVELKVINKLKRGSLTIFKVDEDGNYLENVTFTLLDENGKEIDKQTTGKNGIAKFEKLLPGKYNFKEVDAPINVVADKEEKPVEITLDKLNIEVNVVNEFAKGILKIHKTDKADNSLAGVTFDILDSNKKVIDTLTTDENGIIETKKLVLGTYYYQEKSATDENIIIDKKIKEFKITENNQVVELTVVNATVDGVVIITKVDADNKKIVLQGAKIQILDSNKNVISEQVTDENGQIKLGKLKIGTYYYQEIEAPKGYIKDSEIHEFKITKAAQEKTITFENEAKKLPQTGGFISTNLLIVIIVTVLSIVGYIIITIIAKNKKDQNNE